MIRRKLEIPEPLRIAVVGYNAFQTVASLYNIAKSLEGSDDPAVALSRQSGVMTTKSGIRYEAITTDNDYNLVGKIWDQLFSVDDYRWDVLNRRTNVIDFIRYRLDENIPIEFQVQYMEV
ncbi:MAG: hypothetical protein PHC95_05120 [Parabacteroides sp.]|nr:hypothetical protein [Parabacteroides sp.]